MPTYNSSKFLTGAAMAERLPVTRCDDQHRSGTAKYMMTATAMMTMRTRNVTNIKCNMIMMTMKMMVMMMMMMLVMMMMMTTVTMMMRTTRHMINEADVLAVCVFNVIALSATSVALLEHEGGHIAV